MSEADVLAKPARESLLSPIDRVSEMLFGLFMALSFVGAISIYEAGRAEVRAMFVAAIGCNLAWGLVDAVMFLVQTVVGRGRSLTMLRSVRNAPDADTGCGIIGRSLSPGMAGIISATEIEGIRGRIMALHAIPERPALTREDLLAALGIFLIVVIATFPVVLPFIWITDAGTAKNLSRMIALAMLFLGGFALGRYAGYGSWRVGFIMAGLGTVLVIAINLLGG